MQEKEESASAKRKLKRSKQSNSPNPTLKDSADQLKIEEWFLYILKCSDGSLYTGITKNLERRIKMHNNGRASYYTRSRRPVSLLYQEKCLSRTQALVRECAIKSFPKKKKQELIYSKKRG